MNGGAAWVCIVREGRREVWRVGGGGGKMVERRHKVGRRMWNWIIEDSGWDFRDGAGERRVVLGCEVDAVPW